MLLTLMSSSTYEGCKLQPQPSHQAYTAPGVHGQILSGQPQSWAPYMPSFQWWWDQGQPTRCAHVLLFLSRLNSGYGLQASGTPHPILPCHHLIHLTDQAFPHFVFSSTQSSKNPKIMLLGQMGPGWDPKLLHHPS